MANPKCFQCGRQDTPLLDGDWLVCDHCGERIISTAEFRAEIDRAEEERIKDALGVRNFKPSR